MVHLQGGCITTLDNLIAMINFKESSQLNRVELITQLKLVGGKKYEANKLIKAKQEWD